MCGVSDVADVSCSSESCAFNYIAVSNNFLTVYFKIKILQCHIESGCFRMVIIYRH